MAFRHELLSALRAGLPAAALLALAVGLVVATGAHLSNATPSRDQPYGWPGAATFEGGVATVRPELVLAATLPALLLGLRAVPRGPGPAPRIALLAAAASGPIAVPAATLAATALGAAVAAPSPPQAYLAFWVAHSALALSLFALGLLARAASPRHGAIAALALWCAFGILMDDVVRWQLFRAEGYDNLAAGRLPGWFYVAQVLSPLALYRALLIVWRPGFRDWLEHAALDKATLPSWLDPVVLTPLLVLLWVAVPLAIAVALLWRRSAAAPAAARDGLAAGGPPPALQPHPSGAATPGPPIVILPATGPAAASQRKPSLSAGERTEAVRMAMRPPRPPRTSRRRSG